MNEREELAQQIRETRSAVKSAIRTCRGALGMLTDLEERLGAFDNAQPKEAQREYEPERVNAA